MYDESITTETYGDYKIEILPDDAPCHPRKDYDNLGHMVYGHGRYTVGDEDVDDNDDPDFDPTSWDDWAAYVKEHRGAKVVLPVYMYEHSGITISTSPFSCSWDSGQVGIIYDDREARLNNEKYMNEPFTVEHLTEILQGEIKTYDTYLRGEVVGFRVTGPHGYQESCWGFYDEDDALSEARAELWCAVTLHLKQDAKINRMMAL